MNNDLKELLGDMLSVMYLQEWVISADGEGGIWDIGRLVNKVDKGSTVKHRDEIEEIIDHGTGAQLRCYLSIEFDFYFSNINEINRVNKSWLS